VLDFNDASRGYFFGKQKWAGTLLRTIERANFTCPEEYRRDESWAENKNIPNEKYSLRLFAARRGFGGRQEGGDAKC
jgi:hypothetical protein